MTVAASWFCQFSKTVKQTAQRAVSIFAVINVRLILAAKVLKISVIKELYLAENTSREIPVLARCLFVVVRYVIMIHS